MLQYMDVPKATLRFSNSLGLTELREAFILMVMVYYSERIQIRISNRKRHVGQGPGEFHTQFVSGIVQTALTSPRNDV